jgi:hypothetical protein
MPARLRRCRVSVLFPAKKIFKRIEECAIFTEHVRKTCETVKPKMMEGMAALRYPEHRSGFCGPDGEPRFCVVCVNCGTCGCSESAYFAASP